MPGYWWECGACDNTYDFGEACESRGLPHYIRDVLIPSDWEQSYLFLKCPGCDSKALQIAYEFPRTEKESIRIIRIVGLGSYESKYVPMMWETSPAPYNGVIWFDFKYINGRSVFGLNKPAVFQRNDLLALFRLYCEKTGEQHFP